MIFLAAIVGYYVTTNDLVKSVNAALKRNIGNDNIRLTYNVRTEKVTVHVKNNHQLGIMGRLSIILGIGGEDVTIAKTTSSPYVADLNGTAMIYFYCDIVQPRVVGDTNAKLLKSVPVQGKRGEVVTKTFTNIQYVPVQTKSFEDIEIILTDDSDDTGKPAPFERGKYGGPQVSPQTFFVTKLLFCSDHTFFCYSYKLSFEVTNFLLWRPNLLLWRPNFLL